MNKHSILFAVVMTVVASASCTKEVAGTISDELTAIRLDAVSETTKTYVGEDSKIIWESKDIIAVYDNVDNTKHEFTTTVDELDGTKAYFNGEVSTGASTLYAVYPCKAASGIDGDKLAVTIPAVQQIGENNVSDGALVSVATCSVSSGSLAFRNVFGVIKVTVNFEDVTSIKVRGTNVAGTASVNASTAEIQSVTDGLGEITVTPRSGDTAFAKGDYYIAVLPGTTEAGNFSVELNRSSLSRQAIATLKQDVTIPRNGGFFFQDNNAVLSYAIHIADADDLLAWAEAADSQDSDEVILDADIDMTDKEWIPVDILRGVLNGNGHSIYNIVYEPVNKNAALFETMCGTMKNIKFGTADGTSADGVSKITYQNTSTAEYEGAAGIVGIALEGSTFTDVVTYVTVSTPAKAATTHPFSLGGLVGVVTGSSDFTNCKNCGTITLGTEWSNAVHCFGGLVGKIASESSFVNCKNNGALNLTVTESRRATDVLAGGIFGMNTAASTFTSCENTAVIQAKIKTSNSACLGGIGGWCSAASTFTECTSNATVKTEGDGSNCNGTTVGENIGGIVGYVSGAAVFNGCSQLKSGYVAGKPYSTIINLGGIAGQVSAAASFSDCSNLGKVQKLNKASGTSNLCLGGIIGKCSATLAKLENCTNNAAAQISNNPDGGTNNIDFSIGGIVGAMLAPNTIKSCTNLTQVSNGGSVTKASVLKIGGILGSSKADGVVVDGCNNTGNVCNTSATAIAEHVLGGIVGSAESNGVTVRDCKVNSQITTKASNASTAMMGLLIGYSKTAGSATSGNEISGGKVGTVEITSDNYASYLWTADSAEHNPSSSGNYFQATPITKLSISTDSNRW